MERYAPVFSALAGVERICVDRGKVLVVAPAAGNNPIGFAALIESSVERYQTASP
jgi:hypothetical protein